jgi:hypothetical protein
MGTGRVPVGADRARDADAQRQNAAIGIEREFAFGALIAAMARRLEFLEPRRPPAHWPPQLARGVGAHDVLRMHQRLHAETATDIADDDTNLLRRKAEQHGEHALVAGRVLRCRLERESPRTRDEFGHTAARFQRHRRDALVVDRDADCLRRCANARSHAAASP